MLSENAKSFGVLPLVAALSTGEPAMPFQDMLDAGRAQLAEVLTAGPQEPQAGMQLRDNRKLVRQGTVFFGGPGHPAFLPSASFTTVHLPEQDWVDTGPDTPDMRNVFATSFGLQLEVVGDRKDYKEGSGTGLHHTKRVGRIDIPDAIYVHGDVGAGWHQGEGTAWTGSVDVDARVSDISIGLGYMQLYDRDDNPEGVPFDDAVYMRVGIDDENGTFIGVRFYSWEQFLPEEKRTRPVTAGFEVDVPFLNNL